MGESFFLIDPVRHQVDEDSGFRQFLNKIYFLVLIHCQRLFIRLNCAFYNNSPHQQWKDIDNQVTVAINEAQDNVRYISTLQRFWEPLYRPLPQDMIACLPPLLTSIRNVCRSAHFFNTTENTTGILVKITNQLTLSCRYYLLGKSTNIWDVPKHEVIEKIAKCNEVMQSYKDAFFSTVSDMEQNNEKPWELSPVYIFCNLEKFLKRLEKVSRIN